MSLARKSLERLVPDDLDPQDATGGETYRLHLERYRFAATIARPGRLLDLACGVGYGTRLLADESPSVEEAVGVDISVDSIEYARDRYGRDGIQYLQGDGLAYRDETGFDTIVSLETIEHLPCEPGVFVEHLATLLRPGGVLVASVPTTPSVDVNPHHLHDFTPRSFARIFEGLGFSSYHELRQVQSVPVISILRRSEERLSEVRPNLIGYYASHPRALLKRMAATLRYGFNNHYLTTAWVRPDE